MNTEICERVSKELKLPRDSVHAVLLLLEKDCTVPFIARYRKEATGSLDEEAVLAIKERSIRLEELEARRSAIHASLTDRGLLNPELEKAIANAASLTALEDIYLPYRPKRKTRASIAAEKGLAPLADLLLRQEGNDPFSLAISFLSEEKGVATEEEALQGAKDIIAERISENGEARRQVRILFGRRGKLKSSCIKGKEEEGANFKDWFAWEEPAALAPSHRILAMFRGEREKVLSLSLLPPEEEALRILRDIFVHGVGPDSILVNEAIIDGYRRLLAPSMETELRNALKKKADREAIAVFAKNVREILLASPLGPRNILAVDPGFRTGCKFVCLNRQGDLLFNGTIFPHPPRADEAKSAEIMRKAIDQYGIEAVAIGNGTAGRETERFFRGLGLPSDILITMVNESGASIYSASETARREFPEHDLTVRGAVSIGRRLLDPLAELVKLDPKSIGVGQYQHDVDQKELKNALATVVESCVNAVGVELNTASLELLSFVSGIGSGTADRIIKFREANGPFSSRKELLNVPRLGPKTFEQAAGFLRIRGGTNPLDASAVHPERYPLVERIAADLGCSLPDLLSSPTLKNKIDVKQYISEDAGLPTLTDILNELEKPGRDPRETFEPFTFQEGVEKIDDLLPGMPLPGIVTNITSFGIFVDVGVHQDGLVHRKRLPHGKEFRPGERVNVSVLEVDRPRKRISLSMREEKKGTNR